MNRLNFRPEVLQENPNFLKVFNAMVLILALKTVATTQSGCSFNPVPEIKETQPCPENTDLECEIDRTCTPDQEVPGDGIICLGDESDADMLDGGMSDQGVNDMGTNDQGMNNPDQGMNNPDQGMNDPDQGMNDPDQGMNNPDQGMNNPDQGMNDPDQGMNDPDQGMNNPDQGMQEDCSTTPEDLKAFFNNSFAAITAGTSVSISGNPQTISYVNNPTPSSNVLTIFPAGSSINTEDTIMAGNNVMGNRGKIGTIEFYQINRPFNSSASTSRTVELSGTDGNFQIFGRSASRSNDPSTATVFAVDLSNGDAKKLENKAWTNLNTICPTHLNQLQTSTIY